MKAAERAKQEEETFDAARRERESRKEASGYVAKSAALQQRLASEKRLGALAIRKNAEVHERLRREVEVEAKKAGMLQEELEAATLCLEVRKEDHAKREAEWMSEKSRLEQALKEAVAGAKTIAKTDTGSGGVGGGVGFLRNQLSEARQRLENHRAAHGREVALLRKELQLEQRRTESLAREVNLLRVKDSANFVIKRGSKQELVDTTMSSLRDRVRKEANEIPAVKK